MSQQNHTKARLLTEMSALIDAAFEAGRAEGRQLGILEGKELALKRIRTVIDSEGDTTSGTALRKPQPQPQPQSSVRFVPANRQRSLLLNRAAAGAIIEVVEKLLEEDTSAEGLRPARAVALAKARGNAVKESSVRMALFSLGKRQKAIQSATTKAWFHINRKSAALAADRTALLGQSSPTVTSN